MVAAINAGVEGNLITILQQPTRRHNTNDIDMREFREYQAAMKRRYAASLRCEPLAHRPGDDRGFSMHWSN